MAGGTTKAEEAAIRKGNAAQNVPSLEGVERRLKLPDVLALLETGKGVMPSFAFLSEAQRGALANHLLGVPPAPQARDGRSEEHTSELQSH